MNNSSRETAWRPAVGPRMKRSSGTGDKLFAATAFSSEKDPARRSIREQKTQQ
ncbi:MAG: hypothetical protein J5806_04915 [Lentisphaeria bacterium]|nr:hypothetical protein [Lentisphaeria bacterium]